MADNTPMPIKMLTAGVSGCIADFATFPLDTAKVRLQIQGEGQGLVSALLASTNGSVIGTQAEAQYRGIYGTITTIIREEGPRSVYNGLAAGLQRQMCFASIRLGLYDTVKELYRPLFDGSGRRMPGEVSVSARIAAGLTTGALAVLIAQPTDVVKVRFQAQARTNAKAKRYSSTFHAYRSIGKLEGAQGLWRGTLPNVSRNAIINVAEIVCYDIVKEKIIRHNLMEDAIPCHFASAVVAGFCATVVASPVDVVKTRYMNSTKGKYKGALDCAVRMGLQEGPSAFYKGFAPSFCRLVSWNICMWITYEQMKKAVAMHI